jgi:hypothetical protein
VLEGCIIVPSALEPQAVRLLLLVFGFGAAWDGSCKAERNGRHQRLEVTDESGKWSAPGRCRARENGR